MSDSTTKAQVIENRKKWAEELESGRWKQGSSCLKNGDSYCCLGVAGVAICGMNDPDAEGNSYPRICEALGLTYLDPDLYRVTDPIPPDSDMYFIHANDVDRKAFPEIADMVRALPAPAEVP